MQWVPWFRFQVLMRRLRSLDARQSVLWNICAILEDELMRAKVGWEMLWVHALDRFIGEYATTHGCLFPYASDKNSLRQVFIEAATEGLVGTFGIKIDGQEPVRLACRVLKQLVEAIQVHIASNLLVYLLQLVLVLELEKA